ncbi:MAG: hypothetical protein ABI347_09830, partial [Nitrososphaera sp.]
MENFGRGSCANLLAHLGDISFSVRKSCSNCSINQLYAFYYLAIRIILLEGIPVMPDDAQSQIFRITMLEPKGEEL